MFFPVVLFYIVFAEQPVRIPAPLSAVCTAYVKLFQTTEFTGHEFDRFEQDWPVFQLLDVPYQEFDIVPEIEKLTVGVFMDLYVAQKDYCALPEVASLAQQVADGTHPHALEIWETSLLELIAVYSELSSEESNDGRRKLVIGAATGVVPMTAWGSEGAAAGSGAAEAVGVIDVFGEAALIGFLPLGIAVVIVAAFGMAIYTGYLACHQGNHRRSLRTLRRILNAQMKAVPAQTGLTIPSEDLMVACTDGLQSFLCNAGMAFIAQTMTTAVCGGVLAGFASCVFDMDAAKGLLAIGDGN